MKFRALSKPMIQILVGNGKQIYLWHDNSHPKGPLLLAYGTNITFLSGFYMNIKLSAVIEGSNWHWLHTGSARLLEIRYLNNGVIFPQNEDDKDIWVPSKSGIFHTGATWQF